MLRISEINAPIDLASIFENRLRINPPVDKATLERYELYLVIDNSHFIIHAGS